MRGTLLEMNWPPIAGLAVALTIGCQTHPPAPLRSPVPRVETPKPAEAPTSPARLELRREQASTLLCRVFAELDADCDRRLTVEDERASHSGSATKRFPYVAKSARVEVPVEDLAQASQLVQELVLGLRGGSPSFTLDLDRVHSDPASYLAGRIEGQYWDALTRRIDADATRLSRAAADEKLASTGGSGADFCASEPARCPNTQAGAPEANAVHERFVYFPEQDARAREVFSNAHVPGINVLPLPNGAGEDWVLATTRAGKHGLLTLALDSEGHGRPFVVPGGRFNEMYGWDSFFIVWGLVQTPGRVELARAIVDNQAYEIRNYGKILNANRSYYLARSQPPFFTSAISEVWRHLSHDESDRAWLAGVLSAAITEYESVWSSPPHRLNLCDEGVCLARYSGGSKGEPPEVEPGHFAWFYQRYALAQGRCRAPGHDSASRERFVACAEQVGAEYRSGKRKDAVIDRFFANDACVRESGHDTTYRFFVDGEERCTDFATVDLNALLFKYEIDLATLIEHEFGGRLGVHATQGFCSRALSRARLVTRYLWDEKRGFFDYDVKRRRRSTYVAATALYPLWASAPNVCDASLVTQEMADRLASAVLPELEAPGGLTASAKTSLERVTVPTVVERSGAGFEIVPVARQWEAPAGWAPHQMLAWAGLRRHGHAADAERLEYRWLYTIVENAASYHGTVPEKFDVVKRSHAVFAEYGNVNTEFSYIAEEGFGWMNASFLVGRATLSERLKKALAERRSPEELGFVPSNR